MKRFLLLLIAIVVLIATGGAQNREFNKLCEKYQGSDGIETFRINGFGCWVASLFMRGEESEVGNLVRNCSACQILVSDGKANKALASEIKSFIRQGTLEELITIKEKDEEVKIYVEEHKDNVRQFFITVINGSEMVYIQVEGKFSRAKIRKLMKSVS